MELKLSRNDIVQTGTTHKDTLVLLPIGSNKQQKICCGDDNGVMQCISIKQGELKTSFKSLPTGNTITAVVTGFHKNQKDKIFIAEGSMIVGLTKKGKEFYRFDTNLTEMIQNIAVFDTDLWVFSQFTIIHYRNNKEINIYNSHDQIKASDMVPCSSEVLYSSSSSAYYPVISSKNGMVKLLFNKNAKECKIIMDGIVTVLKFILEAHEDEKNINQRKIEILYGLENGSIGQLFLNNYEIFEHGFKIENEYIYGSVTAIYSGIDLTKSGINDIVIGRDNGQIEIYDYYENNELIKVYSTKLSERINTISGGFITTSTFKDLIFQTYSGKVLALCPPGSGLFERTISKKTFKKKNESSEKIKEKEYLEQTQSELQNEINQINKQIEDDKRRLETMPKDEYVPEIDIQMNVRIDKNQSCFIMTLESGKPILNICLRCDINIELLDTSNIAILSKSPPEPENNNIVLAHYRYQEMTNRVEIRFKVLDEGKSGTLSLSVIPKMTPNICKILTHKISALCMHKRIHLQDKNENGNKIEFNGDFTLGEIRNWLSDIFFDISVRQVSEASSSEYETLIYRDEISEELLICKCRSEDALFISASIPSLCILRDSLMSIATKSGRCITSNFIPNQECINNAISCIWDLITNLNLLKEKKLILQAFQELNSQEMNDCLVLNMIELIKERDQIENANCEEMLINCSRKAKKLLISWNKLMGRGKSGISEIHDLITNQNNSYEKFYQLFYK